MLVTDAALYIPISHQILRKVLADAESLEDTVLGFSVPQIASVILLRYLPKFKGTLSQSPERFLSDTIEICNAQMKRDGLPAVMASILPKLNRSEIQEGYQLLPDFRIVLLDEETLKRHNYLTAEGNWDYGFGERLRAQLMENLIPINIPTTGIQALSAEQSRIYREVKAQADDHMHVQGYAGTGKSSLIKSLLAMLEPTGAQILVLAERQTQLDALLAGADRQRHVYNKTFASLAYAIIPQDLTTPAHRHMRRTNTSRAPIPDDDIVRYFGIMASGRFSPNDIVRAVRSTVAGFCYSGDNEINADHIPAWCASSFDDTTRQVVLHYATELWKAILSPPSNDFMPPVSGYHRIKWASLNHWKIPARYTHILIDECHDLPKSMLQILDCSPQAVISLGDEYQNLQGRPQQRSNIIRKREVTHSIRSGRLIENIVNPIIAIHPGKTKAPFHGNQLNKLEIEYYDKPQVPGQPAAILVSDIWELFEWTQRVAIENVDLELLSNRDNLNTFVNDCIELYLHSIRPRHGELFRFDSWGAVAKRYYNNGGFQRIDRMLRKGYTYKDWLKTSARFIEGNPHIHSIGLIEDVRNREFETVTIAPEVADLVWNAEPKDLAAISSAIYVAVTRAKRRLLVPERLRNWIEDISSTHAQQQWVRDLIDTV